MWKNFLEKLKTKISNISYETWFSETRLISIDNGIAKVVVPYNIHKKNLSENYNDLI